MASVEIMKAVAIDSSLRFGMTEGRGYSAECWVLREISRQGKRVLRF